jgi:hypothetical protein
MSPGELQIARMRIGDLLFSMRLSLPEALNVQDQSLESSSTYQFVSHSWSIISNPLCDVG